MGGFSNLGSVYVEVGADLSALAKDLQGAVSDAAQAGQKIGEGLGSGISQGIGDSEKQVLEFNDIFKQVGASAEEAGKQAGQSAEGFHELGGAAHEAEGGFLGLGEGAGEVAAIFGVGLGIEAVIEGLKALVETSIEAYGEIQLATVALTGLTGSAETAGEVIEKMKTLAMGSIFDDQKLIKAAQEMANIGISAETIPGAMKAVVDAAEASGHSLEAVSSAFDRIINTGDVSTRTLNALGINMEQLGETAGMTGEQVKAAFQAAGPQSAASLEILRETIERTKAAAAEGVVGTVPNELNQLKILVNDLKESVGAAIAGPIGTFISNIKGITASLNELLKALSGGDSGVSVGGVIKAMADDLASGFGLFGAINASFVGITAAVDVLKGKYPDMATAVAMIGVESEKAAGNTKDHTAALKDNAAATEDEKNKTAEGAATLAAAAAATANAKAVKELLATATTLAADAEKTFAEDMRALSIPAIKDLGQAEADVAITRAALVTADGIAKSSLEALNAERAKAVPNAQVLKQLEDDLKTASTNAALARTSLKDAESALDLTRKTAKDAASQLSQDEQAHANFLKAVSVPVVMDYKTALDAVNTAKRTATEADAALTTAEESYNAAVKSGDPAAVAAATNALQTARAKLKVDTDAVKTSEDNLKKSQDAVTAATKEIQTIDKALDEFYLREMIPHLVNLKESINDTVDAKKAATDAGDDLRRIELELESAILNEGDATQHVRDLTTEAAAARLDFTNKSKNLHEIEQIVANDFGITVAQLHLLQDQQTQTAGSAKTLADAYEASGIRTAAALQAEEAAANAAYKAITQDPSAGLQQKLQALQNEINAEIALGQSVPADQQIQLAKMTQQETDYINNSAKRWTDLSNSIHADVQGMFSGLITDLFTGGDFIATITKTLQTIGEQILSAIFKPFTDLISQTISSLITPLAKTLAGWISDALTAIFPSLAGALGAGIGASATVANTAAVTANTAALAALTTAMGADAAGQVAGAAGSAAGSVGSAGGAIGQAVGAGLAATVSAITGVVSAVTGVISVFQQARQENTLNAIELNTRVTAAYLGGDQSMGGITQILWQIKEAILYGYATKDLDSINAVLSDAIPAIKDNLAGAMPDIRQLLRDISTNVYTFLSQINDQLKRGISVIPTTIGSPTAGLTAAPNLMPSPEMSNGFPSAALVDAFKQAIAGLRGNVFMDSKEFFSSFVQFAEDNGLVIPQS